MLQLAEDTLRLRRPRHTQECLRTAGASVEPLHLHLLLRENLVGVGASQVIFFSYWDCNCDCCSFIVVCNHFFLFCPYNFILIFIYIKMPS